MLSTEYKRYAQNDSIVVVDSIEDIPRLRELGGDVHGILCPYDIFTKADEEAISRRLQEQLQQHRSDFLAQNSRGEEKIPQALFDAFDTLKSVYKHATGNEKKINAILKANAEDLLGPGNKVSGAPLLTHALTAPTIGIKENGQQYAIPHKHILIFDGQIQQIVPPTIQGQPSMTIMVG